MAGPVLFVITEFDCSTKFIATLPICELHLGLIIWPYPLLGCTFLKQTIRYQAILVPIEKKRLAWQRELPSVSFLRVSTTKCLKRPKLFSFRLPSANTHSARPVFPSGSTWGRLVPSTDSSSPTASSNPCQGSWEIFLLGNLSLRKGSPEAVFLVSLGTSSRCKGKTLKAHS